MKISLPKLLLLLEGLAVLAGTCILYSRTGYPWGLFAAAFLVPDLAMIGYLFNPRVGAIVYNAAHTYLTPLALAAGLHLVGRNDLLWQPLVWVAHIGADRALGFGLKYPTFFKDSHLGRI